MRKLDNTGKLITVKAVRSVWRREVGAVPQQWGNSSASYPTSKPALTCKGAWPIGISRRQRRGKTWWPPTRNGLGTTTTKSTWRMKSEKTGGIHQQKCWGG